MEQKYLWKILDKTRVQGAFRDRDYVYTVENLQTEKRKNMEINDGTFIVGDIIECTNPYASCPSPILIK